MVILSTLRTLLTRSQVLKNAVKQRSMSDHRTMVIQSSRWQWNKFKDYVHFYTMLGLIPASAVVLYCNIFIGPATLSEIPEDYTPKYWEYYRHPITRWLAKNVYPSPQQDYEKNLAYLHLESERVKLRQLEKEVKAKMAERNDYQAYYYKPVMGKYYRIVKEAADEVELIKGE